MRHKDIENIKLIDDGKYRSVECKMANGDTITIKSCYESWQQYGSNYDELWKTVPIADYYNRWMHGSTLTDYELEFADEYEC